MSAHGIVWVHLSAAAYVLYICIYACVPCLQNQSACRLTFADLCHHMCGCRPTPRFVATIRIAIAIDWEYISSHVWPVPDKLDLIKKTCLHMSTDPWAKACKSIGAPTPAGALLNCLFHQRTCCNHGLQTNVPS